MAKPALHDMVNAVLPGAQAAERVLALSYVPADARAAVEALFALDTRLRDITRRARDPLIGTMRLTWWREALARLDSAPAPAEPLLRALAAGLLPRGISGAMLAGLTDPWERMLAGEVDWATVVRERARLFALASRVLRANDMRAETVGIGWAQVDLARDWKEVAVPDAGVLAGLYRKPWPRALRALGALGLLARFEAAGRTRAGDPRRVARLLAHRLTGR